MPHPQIESSRVIGSFAGEPMHAWVERDAAGLVRHFEDYVTSVYSAALGREVGLTLVREVTPV